MFGDKSEKIARLEIELKVANNRADRFKQIMTRFLRVTGIEYNYEHAFYFFEKHVENLEATALEKKERDKIEKILLDLLKDHKVKHV